MANTRDIAPDAVAGKTFAITGASSGLGRGVAIQLASGTRTSCWRPGARNCPTGWQAKRAPREELRG